MIGAGIILLNRNNEVLLLLRDNKIDIPFPNMWDIPGGKVEEGESPEQALRREMMEEMSINNLGEIKLFKIITSENITDNIFWKRLDINLAEISLNEGQTIEYFDFARIRKTKLAFNYNDVLESFYSEIVKDFSSFKS
ncbi:MAG: NUDIX domain-containing protein [Ignavibacteriales bacterium]|nr:MAG: NUDIX domain-containing protein [Ignavibacteriales bacterium]